MRAVARVHTLAKILTFVTHRGPSRTAASLLRFTAAMSSKSRRRFQRVALTLIGCLLVVLGARQIAYAAGGDSCHNDHRLGHYVDDVEVRHEIRHERVNVFHDDMELHVIVN